ncbi:hypothetical protein EGC86_21010 [Shewanella frigidimarina]|nr:hypothetical protein EGC86_21010 [Shewanella frigidimarina]
MLSNENIRIYCYSEREFNHYWRITDSAVIKRDKHRYKITNNESTISHHLFKWQFNLTVINKVNDVFLARNKMALFSRGNGDIREDMVG